MRTSSTGNIFCVTGPLCGEFTGPGEFPTQRPVTRSFDVFFDLRLNKRLSKQPSGWWFEPPSWSLWRHRNEIGLSQEMYSFRMWNYWYHIVKSIRCNSFEDPIKRYISVFMMASSNGGIFRVIGPLWGESTGHPWIVDSSHKDQWRGALMFFLTCAWTNGWANNRDPGDLKHHGTHYDVTEMVMNRRHFRWMREMIKWAIENLQ